MYFLALATDYDGTVAEDGSVSASTLASLHRAKDTGRRLILVTGREVCQLKVALPELAVFDRVVAENGAVIYDPATDAERLVGAPPSPALIARLEQLMVGPISVGKGIIATWEPHQDAVLRAIHELGLEVQIVFNKGAIMILPTGVNKATGLCHALEELGLSARNVVAVGDAENDHAFLKACGCSAAVANALPGIKSEVDIVLKGDHGNGVAELIDMVIREDARIVPGAKRGIRIGVDRNGADVFMEPCPGITLVVGPSGSGKSTFATNLTERMVEAGYEFCVVDPEGDYCGLCQAICVGSRMQAPAVPETLAILRDVDVNLVINTQAMTLRERQDLSKKLFRDVAHLRARTGRPHWLIVDEAHQMFPVGHDVPNDLLQGEQPSIVLVTVYYEALAHEILRAVDAAVALAGERTIFRALEKAQGITIHDDSSRLAEDEVLYWRRASGEPPTPVKTDLPRQVHKRHCGKYAVGDVGPARSFYFRRSAGDVVGANNLYKFLDVSDEISDATWEKHRRAGDYSNWFRDVIRDTGLASDTIAIERNRELDAQESRRQIRKAILKRYSAPCL